MAHTALQINKYNFVIPEKYTSSEFIYTWYTNLFQQNKKLTECN